MKLKEYLKNNDNEIEIVGTINRKDNTKKLLQELDNDTLEIEIVAVEEANSINGINTTTVYI